MPRVGCRYARPARRCLLRSQRAGAGLGSSVMTSSPAAWAAARALGSIGRRDREGDVHAARGQPRARASRRRAEPCAGPGRRSRAPVATWVTGSASSGRATSDHASSVQSPTYSDATHNSGASDRSTSSLHRGRGRIRPRAAAVTGRVVARDGGGRHRLLREVGLHRAAQVRGRVGQREQAQPLHRPVVDPDVPDRAPVGDHRAAAAERLQRRHAAGRVHDDIGRAQERIHLVREPPDLDARLAGEAPPQRGARCLVVTGDDDDAVGARGEGLARAAAQVPDAPGAARHGDEAPGRVEGRASARAAAASRGSRNRRATMGRTIAALPAPARRSTRETASWCMTRWTSIPGCDQMGKSAMSVIGATTGTARRRRRRMRPRTLVRAGCVETMTSGVARAIWREMRRRPVRLSMQLPMPRSGGTLVKTLVHHAEAPGREPQLGAVAVAEHEPREAPERGQAVLGRHREALLAQALGERLARRQVPTADVGRQDESCGHAGDHPRRRLNGS